MKHPTVRALPPSYGWISPHFSQGTRQFLTLCARGGTSVVSWFTVTLKNHLLVHLCNNELQVHVARHSAGMYGMYVTTPQIYCIFCTGQLPPARQWQSENPGEHWHRLKFRIHSLLYILRRKSTRYKTPRIPHAWYTAYCIQYTALTSISPF